MPDLALLQFINYYFLQMPINSLAIFNCWDVQSHYAFVQLCNENFIYTQQINLNTLNITDEFEQRFLNHKRPSIGAYLDMNCQNSETVIELISQRRLFNAHYHWLLYERTLDSANFTELFEHVNLSVDTSLTYALLSRTSANYTASFTLYDVYNNGFALGGKLNMTIDRELNCSAVSCQLMRYRSALHLRSKYGNRERQKDITMRVSTLVTERALTQPESTLQQFLGSDNNTRVDGVARFGFQLVLIMRDMLQCNMSFSYTDRWYTNEDYDGALDDILTESADISSVPFLISAVGERLAQVSVLTETGGFRAICMFRTPRNVGIRGDEFLKPFSSTVWLLFCVFLLVAAVFLFSTFLVEHYRMRCSSLGYVPSFLSTCLIAFGSACIQGSSLVPSSIGGRVTFYSLYLVTFIMYNYYTSIIVSSLLSEPLKSYIKTLDDLADSGLEVGLEPSLYNFEYLNSSKLVAVRRFVERKIEAQRQPENLWISAEEGIHRMREQPGFVYVFEASAGFPRIEQLYAPHEICDLNEVMLRSDTALHTLLHQNSSYKELFRIRQLSILETGVYAKHFRHWVQQRLNCFANNFIIDVGLEYTAPLFFMLICAYAFVTLILLLEIGYKKYALDIKLKKTELFQRILKLTYK